MVNDPSTRIFLPVHSRFGNHQKSLLSKKYVSGAQLLWTDKKISRKPIHLPTQIKDSCIGDKKPTTKNIVIEISSDEERFPPPNEKKEISLLMTPFQKNNVFRQ